MLKQEFLAQLRNGLAGLPRTDREECLTFYSEMIDDRIEEGIPEEEAVKAAGTVEEIVALTVADIPLLKIAKDRIKPKRQMETWEILLLVLGSPLWLSLALATAAVVLSLYVSVWAVMISLWAVFVSLVGCLIAFLSAGIFLLCRGGILPGAALIGAAMVSAGLSIFGFFGCRAATKGIVALTKKVVIGIKNCLIRREDL